MRVIPINWTDLETAFERNSPDTESFLDTRTGEVVTVTEGAIDYAEQRAKVQARRRGLRAHRAGRQPRAVQVDGALRRRRHRRAAARAADHRHRRQGRVPPLQGRAAQLPDGARALVHLPRRAACTGHMQKWLEKEQLAPKEPPPWGAPKPPPEDEVLLERPAASGEGPGEILRRQAKELIDLVPAVELPAAIAFLDFLRERGVAELGRVPHDPGQAHRRQNTGRSEITEPNNCRSPDR